jgi:S-adenosylmethionine-diacylglycerol 3-amino-3-carboxypropyl transferase
LSVGSFLESLPAHQVDAVVLLDSQDWMAAEEIRALWDAIDRAGSDHVCVIFLTAGAESPLEQAELASIRQVCRRDEERSAIGFEQDRSGIYGGFHCYVGRHRECPVRSGSEEAPAVRAAQPGASRIGIRTE